MCLRDGKEKSRSERSSENHPIKKKMIYTKSFRKIKKGEYIGQGPPKYFKSFNEMQLNSKEIRFGETGIKKSTPIIKLKLFHRFSNYCACGETGLTKKNTLPKSFLNSLPGLTGFSFIQKKQKVSIMM